MSVKIRLMSKSKRDLENAIARLDSVLVSPSPLTRGKLGDFLCYAELALDDEMVVKIGTGARVKRAKAATISGGYAK